MLNLGQINFGLGVDTAALTRATQRVVQFGRVVEQAAQAQGAGARAAEAALRRQEQATLSALQTTLRLNDAIRRGTAGQQQAQMLRATAAAFNQLSDQMTRGQRNTIAYQRALESFGARIGTVQRQLKAATSAANLSEMAKFIKDLGSAVVLAVGPLSGFGARLMAIAAISHRSGFALAAFATGVITAGGALFSLSKSVINTAIDIDRIKSRLENSTGTAEVAAVEFDNLRQMADRTGQEFVSLADQFTRFQAASMGTALEGDKAREIFENLATAVGNFQLDAASAEGVFRAVEQMMSKGNVAAEELRQQLGDRLPGAFKAAADSLGVTTQKLNELLKKGKVSAEEFLIPFSREVKKRLGGDSVDGIDSLRASLNRLNNAWTFFKVNFDEAFGISKAFKRGVDALAAALNFLGDNIKVTAAIVGSLTAAIGLLALPRVISGVLAFGGAIRTATIAVLGLTSVMAVGTMASWLGLFVRVVTVVGAGVAAMELFGTTTAEAAEAERTLKVESDALIASQEKQTTSVQTSAQKFAAATMKKIEALYLQIMAMQRAEQAQREFVKEFDSGSKPWFDRGLDEWFARLVAGAKQAQGATRQAIIPMEKELEALKARFDKLMSIGGDSGSKPKPIIDTEGLDRAGRALRDANQEIEKLLMANQKMLEGPQVFEQYEKAAEVANKVQQFRDRLMDAGVAVDVVKEKVAQYQFALENNDNIQTNLFANMKASFEAFKNIGVNAFNSVADALGKAVADGQLNAETFVNIVKDMVAQIISQILKMAVINPILNSLFPSAASPLPTFAGLGFAKGGAFAGGVQFMAKGGILGGPTLFGTKSGMAVGGEAGDEAVMPLVRSSSGHLGVRAVGADSRNSGGTIVNVITPPGAKTEQRERQSGNDNVQDLIITMVNRAIAGGKMDQSLGARFGGRNRLAGIS